MPPETRPTPRILRFATFEVDLQSRELRKNGLKLKLHGQPFEVLAMLLERPGEVVNREQLRERLWPTDTFVDFDAGVNTAINRLRETLGDSADNPRFIETLPRRGYRFIAPTESIAPVPAVAGITPKVRDSAPSSGIGTASVAENHRETAHGDDLERRTAVTKKQVWLAVGVAVFVLFSLALLLRVLRGSTDQSLAAIEVVPLVSMPGSQRGPAVSPDGSYVAFSSDDGKNNGIYVALIGTFAKQTAMGSTIVS